MDQLCLPCLPSEVPSPTAPNTRKNTTKKTFATKYPPSRHAYTSSLTRATTAASPPLPSSTSRSRRNPSRNASPCRQADRCGHTLAQHRAIARAGPAAPPPPSASGFAAALWSELDRDILAPFPATSFSSSGPPPTCAVAVAVHLHWHRRRSTAERERRPGSRRSRTRVVDPGSHVGRPPAPSYFCFVPPDKAQVRPTCSSVRPRQS